jgi:hypothetical protein
MVSSKTFYDLRDALALPGCPICRLAARAVGSYLDTLLWEMVTDPESRRDIREAQGFCHQHAWRLVRGGPSLGAVIITHDVLRHTLRATQALTGQSKPSSLGRRIRTRLGRPAPAADGNNALLSQLAPQAQCPACEQAEIGEKMCVGILLDHLAKDTGFQAGYRASDGLCLPHFRRVVGGAADPTTLEVLLDAQAAIWQRLVDQLGECIRKCDHRFKDEPRGEETGACVRAIAALVGAQADQDDRTASPAGFPFRKRTTERG